MWRGNLLPLDGNGAKKISWYLSLNKDLGLDSYGTMINQDEKMK